MVKCIECGKKYQLNEEDNPNDYQCDCGGSLKSTKRSNLFKALLIIILIFGSYLIGYLSMWVLDTTNIL